MCDMQLLLAKIDLQKKKNIFWEVMVSDLIATGGLPFHLVIESSYLHSDMQECIISVLHAPPCELIHRI
jgi:hypothetical protein